MAAVFEGGKAALNRLHASPRSLQRIETLPHNLFHRGDLLPRSFLRRGLVCGGGVRVRFRVRFRVRAVALFAVVNLLSIRTVSLSSNPT